MTTHAILLVCSLVGQGTAADPPAANKYGTSPSYGAENKYGSDNKYGSETLPRHNPRDVVASDATPGEASAVPKRPAASLGDRFLQDQEQERRQYSDDATASAGDTDETSWPNQPRAPARVQAAPAQTPDSATRHNPLTPANDAAKGAAPATRTNPARPALEAQPRGAADAAAGAIEPRTRATIPAVEETPPNPSLSESRGAPSDRGLRPLDNELPKATAIDDRSEAAAIQHASAFFSLPIHESAGAPMTLSEALSKRSDRESRLQIAHAYWKLATATAALKIAHDESQRVPDIAAGSVGQPNEIDRLLLESEQRAAAARIHEATVAFVSAQHDLAEAVGSAAGDPLPVAADAPFLGAYATRFDELFTNRTAPVQLRAIHRTLPELRQAIVQRAKAVVAATDALERTTAAYQQRQIGIDSYLAALRNLSAQRQACLGVARAYNDDIADYAINVARDGAGAAELTSMLIRVQRRDSAADTVRRTQPPVARAAENPRRGTAVDSAVTIPRGSSINAGDVDWRSKEASPLR